MTEFEKLTDKVTNLKYWRMVRNKATPREVVVNREQLQVIIAERFKTHELVRGRVIQEDGAVGVVFCGLQVFVADVYPGIVVR